VDRIYVIEIENEEEVQEMSLKLEVGRSVPEETRQVAKAAFPKGNVYLWIGDELGELYADHLFMDLYPVRGQPTISPGRLALITVMQFMEGLTDRQAAEAVRGRIDWKYALGMELTDPGFDFSILSEFRQRLSAGQQEQTLLNVLLVELKKRGWLKARSKQRTDSTHVVASVRQLNRLEMVGETMRRALNELAEADPDWLKTIAPSEWFTRYGPRMDGIRLPKEREKREALIEVIGSDGIYLMSTLLETPEKQELRELPGVEILRQIWVQQYWMEYPEGEEKYRVRLRADDNQPPGDKRIHSPYDVDCRYCTKRSTEWVGYKVHLTETCEAETVHLITHVETSSAVEQDVSVTERIHAALDAKGILPGEHLLDTGYIGAELLVNAKEDYGIVICGPVRKDVLWQANSGDGFGLANFQINWKAQSVTCPRGRQSNYWSPRTNQYHQPVIQVRFRKEDCGVCPVQSKCTRSKLGIRHLLLLPQAQYKALQKARQEQQTPAFWKKYAKRAGIEGTISQGVRAFDIRFSRYIGLAKTHLQMVGSATAMNMYRLYNWVNGVPQAFTRLASFARLAPDPSLIPSGWRA
jgi:transposase